MEAPTSACIIWLKVFKKGPSKICGKQPLKNSNLNFKLFKGCLPQILLSPFLSTLTYIQTHGLKNTFQMKVFTTQSV